MIRFNKGGLEFSHGDSRARASSSYLALGWSQARGIMFGSSRLGDGLVVVVVVFKQQHHEVAWTRVI